MEGVNAMKTIFVSSTFRDFQVERDTLNTIVGPALRMEAGKYGEDIGFCDLRWGIDTSADSEESATQKILSVCMDQIDHSSPYMIILLGERYGYIPGEAHIRSALQHHKDLLEQLEDLEISITQLEIEHGLLTHPEKKPHVYIYIRRMQGQDIPSVYTSESPLHKEKLNRLLQRIHAVAESQVRYYDIQIDDGKCRGMDAFSHMVRKDLLEDLHQEWEIYKDMPPFEKERQLQWKQIQDKKDRLRLHKEMAEQSVTDLLSAKSKFWAFQGESGCGKSVMFSYLCHRLEQHGLYVIPVLCQSSPITGEPGILLDYLIFHMETFLKREHRKFSMNMSAAGLNEKAVHRRKLEYLESLCALVPEDAPKVVLALDALDQLYDRKMERYQAVLPNLTSGGVRVLVTATPDFEIARHFSKIQLKELSGDEITQAIRSILAGYEKELSADVCQAVSRLKSAGNLLYLNMVIQRLSIMNSRDFSIIDSRGGGIHQIERRQLEIVEELPDRAEDLAVALLRSTAPEAIKQPVYQALSYLAVSRTGLRMEDLDALLRKNGTAIAPLDLYVYLHTLQEFFLVRQNGCIDFQHKIIRNGLQELLGEDMTLCHNQLFTHLYALQETDFLRNTQVLYHAYYGENTHSVPKLVARNRMLGYYQLLFRTTRIDPTQHPIPGLSMDVDYDFIAQQQAADLHGIIMSENVSKIENLIDMITCMSADPKETPMPVSYWLEFLTRVLPIAFGESDDELRMQYVIFSSLQVYLQCLMEKVTDATLKRNLALCYLQLARLASLNTNRDMSDEALEHMRMYVKLLEEQIRDGEKKDADAVPELAESRGKLMTLLLHRGNREDLAEVLITGSRLLSLYEKLEMPERTSKVYFDMGLAYEALSGASEVRENAFQCYRKALTLSLEYAESKKDPVSITYRILSTIKLGSMCLDVDNHKEALQTYYMALHYANQAYEQVRDGHSYQYVLMAQEGIGLAMLGMDAKSRAQGLQILISTYKKGLELLKVRSDPGLLNMCKRILQKVQEVQSSQT